MEKWQILLNEKADELAQKIKEGSISSGKLIFVMTMRKGVLFGTPTMLLTNNPSTDRIGLPEEES